MENLSQGATREIENENIELFFKLNRYLKTLSLSIS